MVNDVSNAKIQFLSDNASSVCPEAWEAMEQANLNLDSTFTIAYGEDPLTAEATQRIQEVFETDCEVFFV